MNERRHLTWWDYCIVRASYRLSGDAKHVWEVVRELDGKGSGCFMAPLGIAQQVGIPIDSLHDHRTDLRKLGLLVRVESPGSKLDVWFATLPPGIPGEEPPAGAKAKRQWIRDEADALDRHIREYRARMP